MGARRSRLLSRPALRAALGGGPRRQGPTARHLATGATGPNGTFGVGRLSFSPIAMFAPKRGTGIEICTCTHNVLVCFIMLYIMLYDSIDGPKRKAQLRLVLSFGL